jgi:hypothetical protein
MTPPAGAVRSSKYPFSPKEVEDAVKALDKGETPGIGPYPGLKEARGAVQTLKRFVTDISQFENADIGSKAWETEKGAFAILRVKG